MLTKKDIVLEVADKSGLTIADATRAVNATLEAIVYNVSLGEKVQLKGFGSFESRERAERKGRNPQTGEIITIPSTVVPTFKASLAFKDSVKV